MIKWACNLDSSKWFSCNKKISFFFFFLSRLEGPLGFTYLITLEALLTNNKVVETKYPKKKIKKKNTHTQPEVI